MRGKWILLKDCLRVSLGGEVNWFSCFPSMGRIHKVKEESESKVLISELWVYKSNILAVYDSKPDAANIF